MPRNPISALILALSLVLATVARAGESAAAAVPQAPAPPAQNARLLADGTTVAHWTLANGLRVVTRNVPGAHSAAATLCYRLGTREDPNAHEGLAELVGQAAFTGRAGDVPMRSMSELDQLRPGGYSIKVGPHLTELTEACPAALLPGVLHQVCQRLTGVPVGDSLALRSRSEVRRRLRQNYNTQADRTLHFLSGEMAAGRPVARAVRYATGAGLDAIPTREIGAMLAERLVPANTVLCVVGDLAGIDLHALIARELGSVPAGKPAPPPAWGKCVPAVASLGRPDLRKPMGVVAIIAPALTDTMHAYFTAFAISAAGSLSDSWGRPGPPLTSRFNYSISTDPELLRFYPPMPDSAGPEGMLTATMDKCGEAIADSGSIATAGSSMQWLTGGPLPQDLLKRSLNDPTVIHTLATTLAALESFGDEAFWDTYRERLTRARTLDLAPFFRWFDSPKRRILLVLRPEK